MFRDEVKRKTTNAIATGKVIPEMREMVEVMVPGWKQRF